MGSYTFTWEHPAEEVYVTGTFDDWTKSVKLEKVGDVFQKSVVLKDASQKIYYKFVVDNNWVLNESAAKEPDHEGNVNNFLTPEDIVKPDPSAALISSVGPNATTTEMAAQQPLESPAAEVPGGFPVTPANELDQAIGINPLPASSGPANPVTLAPGEEIPSEIAAQNINEHVKLDKESYEKSDTLPGVPAGTDPTISHDPTISTVGAGATTAALAGAVPTEDAAVPAVVKESQEKAGIDPEASAIPAEVAEKAQVEDELKAVIPEAPATSEGTAGVGTEKTENTGAVAASIATAGGAVAAAAISAKDTVVQQAAPALSQATYVATDAASKTLPDSVTQQLPVAAQEAISLHKKEEILKEVSPAVPSEVKASLAEAEKAPEAAANTEAVGEKQQVEAELLSEVKPVPAIDETSGPDSKPETKADTKVEEESKTAESKTAEPAASETKTSEAVKEGAAANGGSKAVAAEGTTGGSKTAEETEKEKKKKNRLSSVFSRIKHKITDKK